MTTAHHPSDPNRRTYAYVMPLAVFMTFLLVLGFITEWIGWDHPMAPWWRRNPAHWIYPLQSCVVLGILIHYWKEYEFKWSVKWGVVGAIFGVIGIGFWLLPTHVYAVSGMTEASAGWLKHLGFQSRLNGFNPNDFSSPWAWWLVVIMRFIRAAVVVALAEEIMWRGFLMRLVNDWEGDYWKQPFGRATWKSYLVVTAVFMLAHAPSDYAVAWIYGSLTYGLCVWSKNLGACVIMHAVANFLMGCYILQTGSYGLW